MTATLNPATAATSDSENPTTAPSTASPSTEIRGFTVTERAVEKVAAQAATEIPGVGRAARTVLGVEVSAGDIDSRPRVSAAVDGALASLTVTLSLTWPVSVRTVTRAVRDHIVARVDELLDVQVRRVDITVAALLPATDEQRRVQ